MLAVLVRFSRTILVALVVLAHGAVPALAQEDWGPEYYLFSRLDRAVNLTLKPGEELPDPPGISVGVPPASAPRISMLMDTRDDGTLQVGDTFRVRIRTSSDAYVQLIDVGTNGELTELYPRADQPQIVKRGQPLVLDGTKDEEWKVQGQLGREWLLAFASTAPVPVPRELLTPAGADEAARVARLQRLKQEIKAICRERRIDLGFQERDVDIVTRGGNLPPSPGAGPPAGPPSSPPAPPPLPPVPPLPPGQIAGRSTYPAANCYALCVGIDKYKFADERLRDLKCAVADATSVRDRFVATMKVPPDQVRLLTNDQATLAGVRRELEWLRSKAGAGKYGYLYWSSHGTQALPASGGDGVTHSGLVAHDFSVQDYVDNKPASLLEDAELGKWIDAFQGSGLVMVVDACYSGAITKDLPRRAGLRPRGFFLHRAPAGSRAVSWNRGKASPVNTARPNTLVIEASQYDQQAWEDLDVGHGFLTTRLLEQWDRGSKAPILFQDLQRWVSGQAKRDNVQQVPNLVDTVRDPNFIPFGKN